MKKIITSVIILLTLAVNVNAIDVVELRLPKAGKVVLKFTFRNGSVCDPKGKEGITALTAQLITDGGTEKLTASQITALTYPWAASMGSSTDKEVSTLTFQVPSAYLDRFYKEVIRDMIIGPRMDKSDFDRVLSNQKNYVEQVIRQSSDEEFGKKYLESLIFKGTPYEHLVNGTVSGLNNITLEDVRKHHKDFFLSSNLMVGVAGEYPDSFIAMIKEDFNALPSDKPALPILTKPASPSGLDVTIISKKGALGSAISAGFPMDITRSSDEFAALMVANSWLGEHRKSYSRLYQKIREARSMNYGDYTYIEWYENGGSNMLPVSGTPRHLNYFSIWLRPVQTAKGLKGQYKELLDIKVGHAPFALRMALREMNDLITKGMSQADFEATRDFLKSYSKLYIETPAKKLGYLMDSRFYNRRDWIKELDGLLAKLTVNDVNTAIRKYWQTQNMYVAIITDESEVESLKSALTDESVIPVAYSDVLKSSLTPEILKEDEEVIRYPLKASQVKIVPAAEPFQ